MASRSRRARTILALVAVVAITSGGAFAYNRLTEPACPAPASHPEWSVARRWDEALLDAIRRALPNPPVHARNLFHLSVAMWDAWAAYDPTAVGYVYRAKHAAGNVEAARRETISYAAYRVLSARFIRSVGGDVSLSQFADTMDALCLPIDVATIEGDGPAAVGNRIAAAVLDYGLADGSNEAGGYQDPDYQPINPPLLVKESGAGTVVDPNRWQPLQIERMISQNGIPLENGVQQNIGPYWGRVKSFGLPDAGATGMPIDNGPPPWLGDPATDGIFKANAVENIRYSSWLDPGDPTTIDISPAALGGNSLGANDGQGHGVNPVTGQVYAPNVVLRADFARALAEFWADGPSSETPPGHWNVVANTVGDQLEASSALRIAGTGEPVGRLEWDVKLYLALNGAVHDAAIAAWGMKGHYDTSRPISFIRYMGGKGQSSDPSGPSYHPHGLPLEPGLIEIVTDESSAPGERHAHLAGHVGDVAVRSWTGIPEDPATQIGGVEWILAVDWTAYQLPTFVTPSFSGFVSGHSTFSRAAAEVLAQFTGSEYFPGGLGEWVIAEGELKNELGPTADVRLQYATYHDAADQAGLSRLFGGIHPGQDDLAGRITGAACGQDAWRLAQAHYAGTAPAMAGS